MNYTIKNDRLAVTISSRGAEMQSVIYQGKEYLWQGDPAFWKRRDANLFPYVGRLTEGKYIYRGQEYSLPIHGFCIGTEFEVEEQSGGSVTFLLTDNAERRAMFPFAFAFRVRYALDGNRIIKTCTVENRDEKLMHFGFGGHPGFNVPVGASPK